MDDNISNIGAGVASGSIDLSLLSGANATFIAEMNQAWRENPASVDAHWARYFEQLAAAGDVLVEEGFSPITIGFYSNRCEYVLHFFFADIFLL